MLTNTFLHIPYVSERTEQKLWHQGIHSWDDCLHATEHFNNKELIQAFVKRSQQSYANKEFSFFSQKLLTKHHWRAYGDCKDKTCFLDIETTGLSKTHNDITVIGLYDGNASRVYVNGKDMEEFAHDIQNYQCVVTFNGALFDIPFIKAKFPNLELQQFHIDLRFVLKRLGYSGGLKHIEKQMGITRSSDLDGMSGKDAVKLWYQYKYRKDEDALQTLIRYNIEDIENLKYLMDFSYEKLKNQIYAQNNSI